MFQVCIPERSQHGQWRDGGCLGSRETVPGWGCRAWEVGGEGVVGHAGDLEPLGSEGKGRAKAPLETVRGWGFEPAGHSSRGSLGGQGGTL